MKSHYFQYWGKADSKYTGATSWHPLAYHSLDVAGCGHVLLKSQPAWLTGLGRLSGISLDALLDWVTFLLVVHDAGKFGDGFQSLRPDLWQTLQSRMGEVKPGERHDTLGYELLMESLPKWLDNPVLARRGGQLMRPWLAAVTGHHGKPPKNLSAGDSARLLRDHFPASVRTDARQFFLDAASVLVPHGIPLPVLLPEQVEDYWPVSWLMAGLAVTADWLGSNTLWFPYREPRAGLEEYWRDIALPQARRAIAESGLTPNAPAFSGFGTLFPGKTPTHLQAWAELVSIADSPQLLVLEELTGAGKTEAALTVAARLMAAGQGQGIYLALPTMATADAMFDRICRDDSWRRFFAGEKAQLILAHSAAPLKLRLEKANRRDADYGVGEEKSASGSCAAWLADSRKKALLADFGVGTIDQALLAVLPARHQSLRLLGLTNKILVVDEVHACDCYMGELLARLLRFHAALGGSVILLSATLPLAQRARYIKAFADGAGLTVSHPVETAYPLATHFSANGLTEQPVATRAESSRYVYVHPMHEFNHVLQWLQKSLAEGRCAVWIRNSVADAVETWEVWNATYPEHPATLFHARFALVDRLRIGKENIEAVFGPDSISVTRRGKLVIATQVIEQSLDVDFDDMVSDLAPIDLVIQRAGRLQRHRRDADGNRLQDNSVTDGRGGARLAVLMPVVREDAGTRWMSDLLPKGGMVYPDHGNLWLTARWLSKHGGFDLPRQARDMIEAVYDEAAFNSLPEGLKEIAQKADGACRADKGAARGNLLAFDEGYSPTSMQWQDDGEAPTRIGEKTVRVRLARLADGVLKPWAQTTTGAEWALSELTVPRRLIAEESDRMQAVLAAAKITMPDEGRYVVIVALQAAGKIWRGHARSAQGKEVCVAYSSIMGLSMEKGVNDELDQ